MKVVRPKDFHKVFNFFIFLTQKLSILGLSVSHMPQQWKSVKTDKRNLGRNLSKKIPQKIISWLIFSRFLSSRPISGLHFNELLI